MIQTRRSSRIMAKKAKMNTAHLANTDTVIEEETSVEQSVLSNHLVLNNILKYSTFQDLKSYREINHLWNVEAAKIMRNRLTMKPIRVLNDRVDLQTQENGVEKNISLEFDDFMNLMEQSKMFPCNAFMIVDPEWNDKKGYFLFSNWSRMKSLTFGCETDDMSEFLAMAAALLKKPLLLNLEILSFILPLYTLPAVQESQLEIVYLKKLQTLNISSNFPLQYLSSLLKACGNVQNIYCTNDDDSVYHIVLKVLLHLKAIHLLKNISLNFKDESIETLEKVVQQKLTLKKIDSLLLQTPLLMLNAMQIRQVLTKLFSQCSTTLTEIAGMHAIGDIPGLKIPIFSKVVKMKAVLLRQKRDPYGGLIPDYLFPSGVNLADKFPNLKELQLDDCDRDLFQLNDIHQEPCTPLVSLRDLTISCKGTSCFGLYLMKKLKELFPNVTSAAFSRVSHWDFEHIWGFRCLEVLKIRFGWDNWYWCRYGGLGASNPDLDSAFTGFSEKSVEDLYGRSPEDLNLNDAEVEARRVKPSIVDLKHLRKITVIIDEIELPDSEPGAPVPVVLAWSPLGAYLKLNGRPVLSHVAKVFGFGMCPKLQSNVNIQGVEGF